MPSTSLKSTESGTVGPRAAEKIGVEDLQRQGFPSARGSAREQARPRLPDRAKALLDLGNQFLQNGVPIRPHVDRVHRIGIVEIRRRMLEGDHQHAREIVADPVRINAAAGSEAQRRGSGKMALLIEHRILQSGLVVIPGQQHGGAEIDGPAPELRQHGTLHAKPLDPFGIGGRLDRRNHLVADQCDPVAPGGVQRDLLRPAVQVARRAVPALPFPLVVVHPYGVAIGAMKLGIDVEECLHGILARRNLRQALHRRPEVAGIDDGVLPGRQPFDIAAEERHAHAAHLQARLALATSRDHDENPARNRTRMNGGRKRDFKTGIGGPERERQSEETQKRSHLVILPKGEPHGLLLGRPVEVRRRGYRLPCGARASFRLNPDLLGQ